jgi:hypothetical protein
MLFALKLVAVPDETPTELLGKVLKLKKMPTTLGRGKDATIVVRHRKLSRLHCRFYMAEDQLHIRDLGSTNGTLVNGQKIDVTQVLHLGDHISLGGVVFQLGQLVIPHATTGDPPSDAAALPPPASPHPGQPPTTDAPPVGTPPWSLAAEQNALPPNFGSETVDWRPNPPPTPRIDPVPADPVLIGSDGSHSRDEAIAAAVSDQIELDLELGRVVDPSASDSGLPGAEFALEGVPVVAPVSSVRIDSTFVAKVGSADPAALPPLGQDVRPVLDPAEVDLGDIAEPAKSASLTALGEFVQRQDLKKTCEPKKT